MKKRIILMVVLVLLCSFTACSAKSAADSNSAIPTDVVDSVGTATSSTTGTIATVTSTNDESSTQVSSTTNASSKKTSSTNPPQTSSTGVAKCTHDYKVDVVPHTCTTEGYTLHTCKKCGKSYRDSYVAPSHEYGKYLCDNCGRPDPGNPIHSLSAWLAKNGTLQGSGRYSFIDYQQSGVTYSIIGDPYSLDIIYFELEKGNERFRISFQDTNECSLDYFNNDIEGRAEMKSFAVCSSTPLKLTYFSNRSKTVCSQKEFADQMAGKIDGLMKIIQGKMLSPRTGLTLKNLGFKAY